MTLVSLVSVTAEHWRWVMASCHWGWEKKGMALLKQKISLLTISVCLQCQWLRNVLTWIWITKGIQRTVCSVAWLTGFYWSEIQFPAGIRVFLPPQMLTKAKRPHEAQGYQEPSTPFSVLGVYLYREIYLQYIELFPQSDKGEIYDLTISVQFKDQTDHLKHIVDTAVIISWISQQFIHNYALLFWLTMLVSTYL